MKISISLILLLLLILPAGRVAAQEEFYHPELEWRTIETEHFMVHYHTGAERTARVVAKVAEDIYEPVTSLYNHKPDGKVSFVIKDYDDYSNGGAYFFDNKVEIWASNLDFDLRGTHNWLRNVVTHEFTHIVQIQTTLKFGRRIPAFYVQWLQYERERRSDVLYGYPNGVVSYPISGFVVPAWFAEGVAQYNRKELRYDSWDSHRDMILRMYALDNNMLTWTEMAVFGKTSLGNESSYNAGFAFVRYIAERYGEEKLLEISRNLSSLTTVTIDAAIERALGVKADVLYNEWRDRLKTEYTSRMAPIKEHEVAGTTIAGVGFANFYPTFSPDGKSIAYISNKNADYFSLSSLYLYDVASKTERMLHPSVRSGLSWSPDGSKLYYARLSRGNSHWSNLYDLYCYDLASGDETQLTHGLRANAPAVSPDGSTIAYTAGHDGTLNLFTMNRDGSGVRQLTTFTEGEQVYSPRWSPDGSTIVFSYSLKDGRDIAVVPANGTGTMKFLLATPDDERDAVYTPDGRAIVYTSDHTGIFNLYRYDLGTGASVQLTNVLGGAYMPTVNARGQVAFSSYTSSGYTVALADSLLPIEHSTPYREPGQPLYVPPVQVASTAPGAADAFNWPALRKYDDSKLPPMTDTTYRNTTTSLTFVPFIRVDNYNPRNTGLDMVKPGLYAFSYDILDRYGFFGGAAINKLGERDLFFIFDYRGKVPGLYQLGLEPAVSLEVYNITRTTNSYAELRTDLRVPGEVTYSLLEFDGVFRHKFISEFVDLEARYAHSRYNADVRLDPFRDTLSGGAVQEVAAFGNLYFIGNSLSLKWDLKAIAPSRTSEINPVGRKIMFNYTYEFSKLQASDSNGSKYEYSDGLFLPVYDKYDFHRLEGSWKEYLPLPGWKHTLTLQAKGGTILGPRVDDFFNFYIGGLADMKGYPFYSLGGNHYVSTNLTYRFPLIEHIDVRLAQLYFDKLYAGIYGDAGTAWTAGALRDQKFRRDAGVELRLQAFSYYAFPTCFFLNATYGFDQFDYTVSHSGSYSVVTYGKEWNYHFGILFGFDFD